MRNFFFAFWGLALFFSCNSTKTAIPNQETNNDVSNYPESGINQTWTLIAYSAFMNPADLPDYSKGHINWTIKGDRYGQIQVVNSDVMDSSPQVAKPSQFWIEDCTIMIGKDQYFYAIDEIKDFSGKTIGSTLELDSNIDPSLSDDGPVWTFLNQELAQAAGYNPSGTKTITNFKIPLPQHKKVLSGRWTLTEYSAYMSTEAMDKLPKYSEGAVVYTFLEKNNRPMIRITKTMAPHEYDFSMPPGEYPVWTRNCYIQIDHDLFSYSLSDDGNSLRLQKGLNPSIADDEQYFNFKRF